MGRGKEGIWAFPGGNLVVSVLFPFGQSFWPRSFRPDFWGESFRPSWDGSFRPSFKGGLFLPDSRSESFLPDLCFGGKQVR